VIEPQPAATVIVARDGSSGLEVFMLKRSARSAFMPHAYVFPGGRVDAIDRSPSARERIDGETPAVDPSFVFAAARETFEEAGVLLASKALEPATLRQARAQLLAGERTFEQILDDLDTGIAAEALNYFSRWITPPVVEVRRFDARFFVARMPADQVAEADSFETSDGLWVRPRDALDASARDEFAIVYPTIKHLARIASFETVDALVAFARAKAIVTVTPHVTDGTIFSLPPGVENAW
jgi:8-oxo-dGTP pyrophosphatase MutT (NUDIX family)